MQQAKLLLVALILTIPMLGCSDSKPKPAKLNVLTPEQVAEQEKVLKDAEANERANKKELPKEKTNEQLVDEAERAERNRRR